MLLGVAAVRHDVGAVQAGLEEPLVGPQLQRGGHHPGGVGQHAVLGNDGVALDPPDAGHGATSIHNDSPHTLRATSLGLTRHDFA